MVFGSVGWFWLGGVVWLFSGWFEFVAFWCFLRRGAMCGLCNIVVSLWLLLCGWFRIWFGYLLVLVVV